VDLLASLDIREAQTNHMMQKTVIQWSLKDCSKNHGNGII